MVIGVLRSPPYCNLFQVDWFLTSGPDAAKSFCHGRTFASIMASTLFVRSSATRMKPKIAATGATSLLFVKLFSLKKNTGWRLLQKNGECIPGSSTTRNMTIPSRFLFRQLDYVQAGGHLFFFSSVDFDNFHDSQPIPACSRNVCFKFVSLCFLWLPRLPWFLISGLLHVRLTDRLYDSFKSPSLSATVTTRCWSDHTLRSHMSMLPAVQRVVMFNKNHVAGILLDF